MKNINGIDYIESFMKKGRNILTQIEAKGRAPHSTKELTRRWPLQEAADLVGRSKSSLLKIQNSLIEQNKLDPLDKYFDTKKYTGYTLKQLNQFREYFNTFPRKNDETDECLVLAVQSFKGGVGKTVTSLCLAQFLATQGYRILFIDMDSQASATCNFGYIPDADILYEKTLMPYFKGDQENLEYCIKKTYWDGLDLIPANLQLYELELKSSEFAQDMSTEDKKILFSDLAFGIDTVRHKYDVVVIDSPPALGITSLNILFAADALIVPVPPSLYEFSSTLQYFNMIRDVLKVTTPEKCYKFIKILGSNVYANHLHHKEFLSKLREVFGSHMMQKYFIHTNEVGNAAIGLQTVLEEKRPQKRALDIINSFCKEIEIEIWKTWPSKIVQLENAGNIILEEEAYV